MRVPRLCALVTKTGRGRRRLPLDGRKKYYNIILLYDYTIIIVLYNVERTPPSTTVHPTPPRDIRCSQIMFARTYHTYDLSMCAAVDRSNDSIFLLRYIIHHHGIRLSADAFVYHCVFYRPTVCRSPVGEIHETRHYCAKYHILLLLLLQRDAHTPAG